MTNDIACPSCQSSIDVNTDQYLKGVTFKCPNCDLVLGLNEKTDLDSNQLEAFKKFSKMKKKRSNDFPCPNCSNTISCSPQDIVKGVPISCPSCKAVFKLQK